MNKRYDGGKNDNTSCESCATTNCSVQARKPGETVEQFEERQMLARRMCRIRWKIAVLSGKPTLSYLTPLSMDSFTSRMTL